MTTTEPRTGANLEQIPQPPGFPALGNLFDLDASSPIQDMMHLARRYGPIFQLALPGRQLVLVSGYELVNELCDERHFDKLVWSPLKNVRAFAGDGLFTSWTFEPNWKKAHNILLSTFGMQAMKGYMPMMVEVAQQLAQKWERLNPEDEIHVTDDMTRLTLDTIGLCGFNYRFNSFYREEPHPFVAAMVRALGEALHQLGRLPLQTKLMVRTRRQFDEDISYMNSVVDRIVAERKAADGDQSAHNDLLGYMLGGVDKQTGERLDDVNIRYQIITFLIAGHETTSGLLSFALYHLLHHPDVLAKCYDEVDRVLGADLRAAPTYAQVHQLQYVSQVLNESLRLWPTAPAFALSPHEPLVLGGKYAVDKRHELMVLVPMLHRDPSVWGDDAEEFNPDHFSPEAQASRPANAFKPFGNGQRACIGRQFAMQEAAVVMGTLLQRFEFIDHANYQLKIKETLTLKPEDFRIKVRPRAQRAATAPVVAVSAVREEEATPAPIAAVPAHNTPLLVLYGSNLGTAEGVAGQIADDGQTLGFETTVAPLDDYAGKLPTDGAVVMVTSSYNGTPPDNAAAFVRWLAQSGLGGDALAGVRYTVFGCGSRDWASTYQAVPTLVDAQLEAHGARRIYARGEGDQRGDFDGQYRGWYAGLWDALANALAISMARPGELAKGHRYEIETVTDRVAGAVAAGYGARLFTVRENRELIRASAAGAARERSTRHIELTLPEGVTYRTGDHLGVIPRNDLALVRRVAARFGFAAEDYVRIRGNSAGRTPLPLDQVIAVTALLAEYVELQEVAARSHLETLSQYTECPPERDALRALAGKDAESEVRYRDEVFAKRLSVFDLLERYRSVELPFNIFIEMLPPLRPRYYSISSSPLIAKDTCTVTVGVVDAPAQSGNGRHHGVCSWYLAQRDAGAGAEIYAFVKAPSAPFQLPEDPAIPIILVAAGTGLAPFRGFLQERAALRAQGRAVAPSLLFFGCRNPDEDYFYRDELEGFERLGLTTVHPAFSRVAGRPKTYVQDVIRRQADDVWKLIEAGAVVYVCGDASRMAPDVRAAFASIFREKTGLSADLAEAWLAELASENRYLVDVWPSS